MSHLPAQFLTLITASGLLLGCSATQTDEPQNPSTETTTSVLRVGPALTEAALEGMYMSRTNGSPEGLEFVQCLDKFVLRFDEDTQVSTIFNEISDETDTPVQSGNIAYFTDQAAPERYKRLVDRMIEIDGNTENDIFNFDSSSTCVLSPEDCTLPAEDANAVRLYWTTIEHGSMGCFE